VLDEVKAWQSRSLDKLYPIMYFDALMIKVHEDGKVINKAFYLALGVNTDGPKELLGIWISESEGAKFWLNVLTELQNRGVDDILAACIDGLTSMSPILCKRQKPAIRLATPFDLNWVGELRRSITDIYHLSKLPVIINKTLTH
jgi:transposase-like protein